MDAELLKPTALVIDDDPDIRELLTEQLQDEGYRVLATAEGAIGLRLAEHDIDVAILDVVMPRMNGLDICAGLRENPRTAHVPVLFLSSCEIDMVKSIAVHHGAYDFLAKPFDQDELMVRLAALREMAKLPSTDTLHEVYETLVEQKRKQRGATG